MFPPTFGIVNSGPSIIADADIGDWTVTISISSARCHGLIYKLRVRASDARGLRTEDDAARLIAPAAAFFSAMPDFPAEWLPQMQELMDAGRQEQALELARSMVGGAE